MDKLKKHSFFRIIAKLLVLLLLSDVYTYASGQARDKKIEVVKKSKKNSGLAVHLAPTSSIQLPYRHEYGKRNVGTISEILKDQKIFSETISSGSTSENKMNILKIFSQGSKFIFSGLIKYMKHRKLSLKLKNNVIIKFAMPLLITLFMTGNVLAKSTHPDINTRQNAYVEWVNHVLLHTADKNQVKSELLDKLRYSADPAEFSGAAVILKKYWKDDLGKVIKDASIPPDRKKEIILVSSLDGSGVVDTTFLCKVLSEMVETDQISKNADTYVFSLGIIKGELLKDSKLIFNMEQMNPVVFAGKMNLLLQVIHSEPDESILRESAIKAFLAGFTDLSMMVSFIRQSNNVENLKNSIELPFKYENGRVAIAGHGDRELASRVMSALKSKLAEGYLEKRSGLMHFNNELIEKNLEVFFGTSSQAYASQILPMVRTHIYPEKTMNILYPDIAKAVANNIKYLFQEASGYDLVSENAVRIPKILTSKSTLSDVYSNYAKRKLRAVELLKSHGAVYSMLNSDETSRLALREVIRDNTTILLYIYLDENSSDDDRQYCEHRMYEILSNGSNMQLSQMHQMSLENGNFRNALVKMFSSTKDVSIKISLADMYFRSGSDFAELIDFYRELENDGLKNYSKREYEILKEASNSEIRRRIAMNVLERKIGIDKTNTDVLLFHVDEPEIASYKTLYKSLDTSFQRMSSDLPLSIEKLVDDEFKSLVYSGKNISYKNNNGNSVSHVLKADVMIGKSPSWILKFILAGLSLFGIFQVKKYLGQILKRRHTISGKRTKNEVLENIPGRKIIQNKNETIKESQKQEILGILTALELKSPDFSKVKFTHLDSLLASHFESPYISADMENRLLRSLINIRLKKDSGVRLSLIESMIRKLLQKIYVQKFISSPLHSNKVPVEDVSYIAAPPKNLIKNIWGVLTAESLMDSKTIIKLGDINQEFKILFADKFKQTNVRMRNWIIKSVFIQFLLIVVPSFLIKASSVPTSIILGWGFVAMVSIMIRSSKLGESENTSLEVDKTLKLLLQTVSSKYGIKSIPETKNISQGIKGR